MRRNKKENHREQHQAVSVNRLSLLLSLFCLLIILVHVAASFFPQGRIWGINQWAYFPLKVSLAAGVLVLLSFIPPVNAWLRIVISSVISLIAWVLHPWEGFIGKKKLFRYTIFSLPFFLLFWVLKDRIHLLGDGAQIISQMNSGKLLVNWSEPLEIFIHLKAFQLTGGFWQMDAAFLYAVLSCLAGVLWIFCIYLLTDLWGEQRKEKVLIVLILLSMGSIQLFFGYVEHYSFSYLFVFTFILSSLGYLERKAKWFFPLITFILAALSHFSNLYLFPALLFLYTTNWENHHRFPARKILIGILGFFFLGLVLLLYQKYSWTKPPFFVPITEDRYSAPGYLLFSFPHLADFLNQQLLISPVGLATILAALFSRTLTVFSKNKTFQLLLLVSIPQLLFSFLVDPGLGAARDWDMFSAVGLGYTLLGLYVFLHLFRGKSKFGYLSLILVLSSLFSTIPWMVLNSNASTSIARFQNLLDLDKERSTNGHFALIKYFETKGLKEEAEKENQKYREAFPEVVLLNQASLLVKLGELDKAKQLLMQAVGIAPKMPQIRNLLGRIYLERKELNRAEEELKKAIQLGSFLPDPYVDLADVYITKQEYDQALEVCKKAIQLKAEYPQIYSNIAAIYFLKGELTRAEDYYKEAIKLDPKFADAYVDLGDLYGKKANLVEAIKLYQTALGLNPNLAMAHFRLGVVYLSLDSKEKAKEELKLYLQISPEGKNAQKAQEILSNLK